MLFNSKDIFSGMVDIMRRSGSSGGNLEVRRVRRRRGDVVDRSRELLHCWCCPHTLKSTV
jgi:hypothetical protein